MHHGHIDARFGEAIGGFKPQQSAADHCCARAGLDGGAHLLHIGAIAKGQHARQVSARQWQAHGVGAGGEHQFVPWQMLAIGKG